MVEEKAFCGIFKFPLAFDKKLSLDQIDKVILEKINGGVDGTLELSTSVKMAPKNLLNRIKKYQRLSLIETRITPQKPKGWKRHFKLTQQGRDTITFMNNSNKHFKEIFKNEK